MSGREAGHCKTDKAYARGKIRASASRTGSRNRGCADRGEHAGEGEAESPQVSIKPARDNNGMALTRMGV